MKAHDKFLHDALLENNLLTASQLRAHLASAQSAGSTLKEYILQNDILLEKQILIALSQK